MEGKCEFTGAEEPGKPIVVILVGAPGSGKSTFCDHVMLPSNPRPWVRICQDTIKNGKSGTKAQCLQIAASALKEGKSVFIDRCSLDREQRAEFVKLGDPDKVEVHAVVLDLPARLCISRSVKRTGHEGNLQGGKAAAVVNRMLQAKELPQLSEGFSRITYCQNENDVQVAVDAYAALGPLGTLPSGYHAQKTPGTKIQLGIMQFLKKGSESKTPLDSDCSQNVKETDCCGGDENLAVGSETGLLPSDDVPTLAFPSISTSDFQFDLDKASDIIVEKAKEFTSKLKNARLVLVDLSHGSRILSLVKSKSARENIDSRKFFTFVGNITQLYTKGGLQCRVIANAANWRLKPGGGGVNAAIYSAAGPCLDAATKERAKTLLPGKSVMVPLPPSSPLSSNEGVTHIIHVLGPNMNPHRPNCLNGDYIKGCEVLRDAYSSLFEDFLSLAEAGKHVLSQNIDQKRREGILESDERSKRCKEDMKGDEIPNNENSVKGRAKSWGSWAQALYVIAMNPEKHMNIVLETDVDVVVINDLYPKAQKHVLVLARSEGLDCLGDVQREHLQLLRKMHSVGLKWVEKFRSEDASLEFRLGYHLAPSLRQLHLHVISLDFDSLHLKHKKHWNSFNTAFFLDSVDVIEEVDAHGQPTLKAGDPFLSTELRCHRCRSVQPNIPRLKSHIRHCRAPLPSLLHRVMSPP